MALLLLGKLYKTNQSWWTSRVLWNGTYDHVVIGLCERNSLVTGEVPTQGASNEENVSICWHYHEHGSRYVKTRSAVIYCSSHAKSAVLIIIKTLCQLGKMTRVEARLLNISIPKQTSIRNSMMYDDIRGFRAVLYNCLFHLVCNKYQDRKYIYI